jgi:CPA2 family monovalent cation:H+ antiporter-2
MHEVRTFLQDLALVFCVATLAMLLVQRLRQPAVLGYLVAGLIVGPHVALPLFADQHRIETLSELGVVFVMFSIGLEFSLSSLLRLLPTAGLAGLVQITGMMWLGYLVGQLFGLDSRASTFVGGMVCVSSTMIVARVLNSQPVPPRISEAVLGILVVQDLAAILLLTVFTALAQGHGLPASELLRTGGQLLLFLVAVVVAGILIVPRLVREAYSHKVNETLLVAAVGVCFALALLAQQFGYSVALGAFLAGVLVGESGRRHEVAHTIEPLRDLFAAVFFISVGMLVDPAAIPRHWGLILVLTLLVVVGQSLLIALGVFLTGRGIQVALCTGMTLAQIGEFSFIIVGLGVAARAVSADLLAVAVTVSALTTFLTPALVRASQPMALAIEARLPHRLQTFAALYASWFESLTAARREPRSRALMLWRRFAIDAVLLLALAMLTGVTRSWLGRELEAQLGMTRALSSALVLGAAALLAAPFAVGVVRIARALGAELGRRALPETAGVDLAHAPRRAFVLTLQLGLVFAVAVPLVAVTQPFLPVYVGPTLLAGLALGLGLAFWRSTTNLEGHVHAGAQVVLEVLSRQRAGTEPGQAALPEVAELLPGLGPLVPVRIETGSPAEGKTLAELNLRGLTGATVIAIQHVSGGVVTPTGKERLAAGDLISITGSHEAISAAQALLQGPGAAS